MPPSSILSFGCEISLLETRRLLLEKAGFQVVNAYTLSQFESTLTSRRFDLLLFCHSLPQREFETAVAMAVLRATEANILALTVGALRPCSFPVSITHVNASAGPARLTAAVRCVMHERTLNPNVFLEIEMAQYEGLVKWFNNTKGYGFVGRNDGGSDVFTHYSAIQSDGYKTLKEGDPVTFDIIQGEKGPQADQVRLKKSS